MNAKESIIDLWKKGYFQSEQSRFMIKAHLNREYGVNYSEISVLLSRLGFLRKTRFGWIQKYPFDEKVNPKEFNNKEFFTEMKIHPEVISVCKDLYENKHYPQAVFEAFKVVNNKVKEKTNIDEDGTALMFKVFSKDDPFLKLNNLKSRTEKDEQEGFMHIFSGSMLGIRNPKAHDNIKKLNVDRAREYITLASLLCKRVDEAQRVGG